ncbi:MAG TPA: type II secretion system F family protein [Planctomycetota bacterium]|nr:type II secretion system F family protein [Planctomycetota bacterium]
MTDETSTGKGGRLSAEDLDLFNRQILTAARAGAPLVPALRALSRDLRRGRLKATVEALAADLAAGESFADALSRYSGQFPPLYAAMADAAAASGNLQGVMEMVSHVVTSAAGLRRKVVTAAAYPILVLCAAAGLLAYLLVAVLPGLDKLLHDFRGVEFVTGGSPGFTAATGSWYAAAVGLCLVVGALLALLVMCVAPGTRRMMSGIAARLPFYGPVLRAQRAFLFCRTLSVLLRGGVPMREAIRVVREVLPDRALVRALDRVADELQAGEPLSQALAKQGVFPWALVWTVSVAENRGDLPQGLYDTSEFYREEAERRSLFIMQTLPAFMVIFVGVFVAAAVLPVVLGLVRLMSGAGSMMGGF